MTGSSTSRSPDRTRLQKKLVAGDMPATLVTTMALRIRRYDRYVADFLATEPDGVVVNLGCGLDDRRRQVAGRPSSQTSPG